MGDERKGDERKGGKERKGCRERCVTSEETTVLVPSL